MTQFWSMTLLLLVSFNYYFFQENSQEKKNLSSLHFFLNENDVSIWTQTQIILACHSTVSNSKLQTRYFLFHNAKHVIFSLEPHKHGEGYYLCYHHWYLVMGRKMMYATLPDSYIVLRVFVADTKYRINVNSTIQDTYSIPD